MTHALEFMVILQALSPSASNPAILLMMSHYKVTVYVHGSLFIVYHQHHDGWNKSSTTSTHRLHPPTTTSFAPLLKVVGDAWFYGMILEYEILKFSN